jgi:hypothetical protein
LKTKTLNDAILRGVGGQHGEHAGGGLICEIRGFSADSRKCFCFSSQTPGKSWIFSSSTEISNESDKYQAVKSQIDRAFRLSFEDD